MRSPQLYQIIHHWCCELWLWLVNLVTGVPEGCPLSPYNLGFSQIFTAILIAIFPVFPKCIFRVVNGGQGKHGTNWCGCPFEGKILCCKIGRRHHHNILTLNILAATKQVSWYWIFEYFASYWERAWVWLVSGWWSMRVRLQVLYSSISSDSLLTLFWVFIIWI